MTGPRDASPVRGILLVRRLLRDALWIGVFSSGGPRRRRQPGHGPGSSSPSWGSPRVTSVATRMRASEAADVDVRPAVVCAPRRCRLAVVDPRTAPPRGHSAARRHGGTASTEGPGLPDRCGRRHADDQHFATNAASWAPDHEATRRDATRKTRDRTATDGHPDDGSSVQDRDVSPTLLRCRYAPPSWRADCSGHAHVAPPSPLPPRRTTESIHRLSRAASAAPAAWPAVACGGPPRPRPRPRDGRKRKGGPPALLKTLRPTGPEPIRARGWGPPTNQRLKTSLMSAGSARGMQAMRPQGRAAGARGWTRPDTAGPSPRCACCKGVTTVGST